MWLYAICRSVLWAVARASFSYRHDLHHMICHVCERRQSVAAVSYRALPGMLYLLMPASVNQEVWHLGIMLCSMLGFSRRSGAWCVGICGHVSVMIVEPLALCNGRSLIEQPLYPGMPPLLVMTWIEV